MRRRRRARVGQERRKSENRRPILKMLRAALLQSFRGQHSKKMKGSIRGNWDPREGQQPFRPNPNGAWDRTTTLRRLLIGAEDPTSNNSFQLLVNNPKVGVHPIAFQHKLQVLVGHFFGAKCMTSYATFLLQFPEKLSPVVYFIFLFSKTYFFGIIYQSFQKDSFKIKIAKIL